jgi:hypothetical protein
MLVHLVVCRHLVQHSVIKNLIHQGILRSFGWSSLKFTLKIYKMTQLTILNVILSRGHRGIPLGLMQKGINSLSSESSYCSISFLEATL